MNKSKIHVTEINKRFNTYSLQFLFSLFKNFYRIRNQTFMACTWKGLGGLEICLMFTDSVVFKQQIYCSFFQRGWAQGIKKLLIFCGRHNCMVPNIKTCFDQK